MPKYAVFFSFTGDAMARFIDNPGDRRGPVTKLAEAAGGTLESYYWMFGQYDGVAIFDFPDSATAACLSLAVTSSGAFRHFETHELIPADDLVGIAEKAKALRSGYEAPWATRG